MFLDFYYLLRNRGMDVSLTEWLTLMESLKFGLHGSSMTGFYYLCRAILCKSEVDYDKFQQTFLEFFHDVFYYTNGSVRTEMPDYVLDEINASAQHVPDLTRKENATITEAMKNWTLQNRAQKHDRPGQTPKTGSHNGDLFVATDATSPFHSADFNPDAIRVGGKPLRDSALKVPIWDFKDFREDNRLSIRQFQMAFRRLCLYSEQFPPEKELDVDRTVHDTCQKAGILQIRHKKPRRNTIKVLLLIDSGGTMSPHSQLCSRLFQAVSRSNRFKDLKIYYFHNCIDESLFTNPTLRLKYEVSTKKVLRECDKDYKVIFVGDGTMDVNELLYPPAETTPANMGFSGQAWLKYILSRYRYTVWLTPLLREKGTFMGTWGESYDIITDLFDMYPLTVAGLEQAMKQLMGGH